MTCINTAKADALRFITGFEMKHGHGPSTYDVADAQFSGDLQTAQGVINALLAERRVRRSFPSNTSKLQALAPLPVPRSPFGEPLHFIRTERTKPW